MAPSDVICDHDHPERLKKLLYLKSEGVVYFLKSYFKTGFVTFVTLVLLLKTGQYEKISFERVPFSINASSVLLYLKTF